MNETQVISHRELALSCRRDGKTYEQIEALFGGIPCGKTAQRWVQQSEAGGRACTGDVGWATGLPLANGTLSISMRCRRWCKEKFHRLSLQVSCAHSPGTH
jgi:hypothetical protein